MIKNLLAILIFVISFKCGADSSCDALLRPPNDVVYRVVDRYFDKVSSKRILEEDFLSFKNNKFGFKGETFTPQALLNGSVSARLLFKGEKILFSDGQVITLGDFLGAGNSNQIFAIKGEPEWVVRIPTPVSDVGFRGALFYYQAYASGMQAAADAGYPVVRIKTKEGITFAERLKPFQTLDQFFEEVSKIDDESKLNSLQKKKVAAAVKFAEVLKSRTDVLYDLGVQQTGWQKNRWVIIDSMGYSSYAWRDDAGNVINYYYFRKEILESMLHFPSIKPIYKNHFLPPRPAPQL